MSKNSNQSTPAAQTPNSTPTPPAIPQEGSQIQVAENQPVTPSEGESQPAPLTPDEIEARIQEGIDKRFNDYLQDQAEKKAAADLAEKQEQENVERFLEASKPKSTWPFGNKDTNQDFDLRDMTDWKELPSDKVLIVLPKYNTDGAGNKIGYDVKNSLIQPIDPSAYKAASTPDKKTGSTTYSLLGVEPVVIHDPSK